MYKYLIPTTYLTMSTKELMLFCLRFFFGFWLLFVGTTKWVMGHQGFIGYISNEFASTFLPSFLVTITAWIIIIAEPLLGLLLIIGFRPRLTWLLTAKLLFILIIGKTILSDFQTVSNNWIYLLMAIGAASFEKEGK
jgi:uncharacterized membrane protein YphA (DoxX/SURF4 family)